MPDVLDHFGRVKQTGDGRWTAQCPAHDDGTNSLSIGKTDAGRWLLNCFAGCAYSAIRDAAGLTNEDLNPARSSTTPTIVATYDYQSADGALLYQVVRYAPKTFRPRRPDGAGGWIPNLNGTTRVLYHLPDLQGQRRVFLVEGEKDADRLRALGLSATTNAFGAGKWNAAHVEQLTAAGCREVIVLPDNDPAGATHGRMVARSCADAGIAVKLIALPDLPVKGDVSDYLARHSLADLLALVDAAPFDRGDQRVADPPAFALTTIADFLDEPDDATDWIVADRIPAGGVVLFVGAPKAGKSTAVRELAAAVAHGDPWLGHQTTRGAVWLLAFEDKRSEVRRHLRRLGTTGADPLRVFAAQAPGDLLLRLGELAATDPPALIIVDTLARAMKLKDVNDYAQVSAAFEPWQRLTRKTGATLLFVHHASSHASRDGLDAVLGSTAIPGSADNVLLLRRINGQRILSSDQRIGPNFEPTIIAVDEQTGRLVCAGTKRVVDARDLRDQMVAALATASEPMRESWLHDQVDGRRVAKQQALRILLSQGRVIRTGRGGRGDPYLYRLADSGTQMSGTRIDSDESRVPAFSQKPPINPDLFDAPPILVPDVPDIYRVPESENEETDVRTSFERTSVNYDHSIQVPDSPGIAQSDDPKTAKDIDKTASDSGTQIPAIGTDCDDDGERF